MRIIQIRTANERRVAVVEEPRLKLLDKTAPSVYALAREALASGRSLTTTVERWMGTESLDYDDVYQGRSAWRILPAADHPQEPARCLVSGTGLTHRASAENRTAMHESAAVQMTDSMRMYQSGVEGGRPVAGEIGVQPEWFYKGNGRILCGHGDALNLPAYAWDGGEEPEIAGIYLISDTGEPLRLGFAIANEFSDHRMEKTNYLYLAPSKLRNCAIGPELSIGNFAFDDVPGRVAILRGSDVLWQKEIRSGGKNMCHSLENLEHHHFKYAEHRQPGDMHVHFFGASAFSFGDGLMLEQGDVMEVAFPLLGRPLRNALNVCKRPERLIEVQAL